MDTSGIAWHLNAILCLIRTRSGPSIACHWPSHDDHVEGKSGLILGYAPDTLARIIGAEPWAVDKKIEIQLGDTLFVSSAVLLHEQTITATGSGAVNEDSSATLPAPEAAGDLALSQDGLSPIKHTDSPELGSSFESGRADAGPSQGRPSLVQIALALGHGKQRNTTLDPDGLYEHVLAPLLSCIGLLQRQGRWLDHQLRHLATSKASTRANGSQALPVNGLVVACELSAALRALYEALSRGEIAHLRLGGQQLALQLPGKEDPSQEPLAIHSAILLLDDKSKLLQELDLQPSSAALAFFVTHITPTKSIAKLAVKLNFHIDAAVFLTKHLVRWRKARIIPVLHARNTYVISPNANMAELPRLEAEYSRRFPALPDLESMLGTIGAPTPVPFVKTFPSRAHRDIYMDILAWLVRNELVVRLRTIGWLSMPSISNGDPQSISHSSLILHPQDLSAEQKRFIRSLVTALKDKELDNVLVRMLAHLDGEHTLEDIALQEGFKRAKVEECLDALREQGALRTIQCL